MKQSDIEEEEEHHAPHPWKARFIVSIIMIAFAFIGLVIGDIYKDGSWIYWRIMVPVFAVLCLWLSWYLRRKKHSMSLVKIWHEILHWIGLIIAVYMVTIYVNLGLMGRFEASLVVLTLLALTLFIAGIYIEISFMVLGVMMGLFSWGAGVLATYLYSIMLPVTIIAAGIIFWIVWKKRHTKPSESTKK